MISSPLIDVVYLFGCMLDLTYSILLFKDAKLKGYLSYMHMPLISALEDNALFLIGYLRHKSKYVSVLF